MCEEVVVLKLEGWQRSVGVNAEIAAARAMGKPITFLEPVGFSKETARESTHEEEGGG